MYKLILSDDKVEKIIGDISKPVFTSLDFAQSFKELFPEEWASTVKRYGNIGDTDRYTILDYLANRLEYYSQNRKALLKHIPRFTGENKGHFREVNEEEKKYFDRPTIMIFHKM